MIQTDMPPDVLKDHIKSALSWASEMSEVWTNTMMGDFIDRDKLALEKAVLADDEDAYDLMVNLVHLCKEAEREAREGDF